MHAPLYYPNYQIYFIVIYIKPAAFYAMKINKHKQNVNVHDWKRTDYWVWCLTPLSTNISGVPGSVLLVEENGVYRENHGPATSHWQTLSHNVVSPRRDSNS